jgi:hypothetical protein
MVFVGIVSVDKTVYFRRMNFRRMNFAGGTFLAVKIGMSHNRDFQKYMTVDPGNDLDHTAHNHQ